MSDLCTIVRANLSLLESTERMNVWEDAEGNCAIESDTKTITVYEDDRSDVLFSSILFKRVETGFQEQLYTYIIATLFDDTEEVVVDHVASAEVKVQRELRFISTFLNRCEQRGISGRDLYFFYEGYNSGYARR